MKQFSGKLIFTFFLLVVIATLGFNFVVELRGEEPRRALVAMEMVFKGDYIVPHTYGLHYYNKPPFFNWLIAICYNLFNDYSEWVVRIPSVLSYLISGLVVFLFSKKYFGKDIGIVAAAMYYTIFELLFYGTIYSGEIDLFFSLIVLLQVLSVFYFYEQKSYLKLFVVSYFFTAIGTLTKGAPALAFQVFTLLGVFIVNRRFLKLLSIQHTTGIGLLFLLGGTYFAIYSKEGELDIYLVNLFKDASQKSANEGGFASVFKAILVFPFILIKNMLPWSLIGIVFFIKSVRQKVWGNKLLRFTLIFLAFNLPIYSIAPNIRNRYLYMFFPFFIFLLAAVYKEFLEIISTRKKQLKNVVATLVVLAGFAFSTIHFVFSEIDIFRSVFFGLLVASVGVFVLKTKNLTKAFWIIMITLLIGRVGYSVSVLSAMKYLSPDKSNSSELIDKIDEVVKGNLVQLYEKDNYWWKYDTDLSIAGKQLVKKWYYSPRYTKYAVPYYYGKKTGNLLVYTDTLVSGNYYLSFEESIQHVKNEIDTLYTFKKGYDQKLVVYRYK